jgi:tRNA dimethylallyltransferase
MEGVIHYFVDSHELKDELTAAQFEKEAYPLLLKEFKKHDDIILTGGSGLFIDALCFGLDNIPTDKVIREKLNKELEEKGFDYLQRELKRLDPEHYEACDIYNSRRVIRALEAIHITGEKYSVLRKDEINNRSFEVVFFIIDHEREKLYNRINRRVDLMLANGLIDEVKSVLHLRNLTTLRTVGYQELFDYFDDKFNLKEAIELIKRNTRRYAKRQLTWFRRYENATWIKFDDADKMLKRVLEKLKDSEDQSNV